jgi:diaminopimelate decarboxylase
MMSTLFEGERVPSVESIAKLLIGEIRQGLGDSSELKVIVEPGRFVVSSAGILLVSVDHVKHAGGYKWVLVDGGTNLLPRFGSVELHNITVANKASSQPEEEVNIVGPLLYDNDFITLKAILPKTSEADILSIFDCGAYTLSRANQFLHPRPATVLLNSEGTIKVIRERETFEDFLHKDNIL